MFEVLVRAESQRTAENLGRHSFWTEISIMKVERDEHVQIGVEKELPKEVREESGGIDLSKIEQAEASS